VYCAICTCVVFYRPGSIGHSTLGSKHMTSDKNIANEKIESLKKEIADLKSQWPAHSVPAAMVLRLDELEEELEKAVHDMSSDEGGN
ncbi:MAG: hypothetical protein ACK2UP_07090, partial [Candidatus Promineifilaceae bacterium]